MTLPQHRTSSWCISKKSGKAGALRTISTTHLHDATNILTTRTWLIMAQATIGVKHSQCWLVSCQVTVSSVHGLKSWSSHAMVDHTSVTQQPVSRTRPWTLREQTMLRKQWIIWTRLDGWPTEKKSSWLEWEMVDWELWHGLRHSRPVQKVRLKFWLMAEFGRMKSIKRQNSPFLRIDWRQ